MHRVTTYIPWPIAEGTGLLQDEVPHRYGIHGVLEDRHHAMTRIREEVTTRMPRPGRHLQGHDSQYLRPPESSKSRFSGKVQDFVERLPAEAPPLARITGFTVNEVPCVAVAIGADVDFRIVRGQKAKKSAR